MTVGITELPPEGMQLGGVALAGDVERGTKTTEGLSLLFTTAGITVQGPQPQIERLLVWSGLDSATCREKVVLPDGRNAAVMELTSGGQSIRFLFPTETVTPGQAAYLDQALPHWLARYKGATPAPVANGSNGQGAPAERTAPANGTIPPPPPASAQPSYPAAATAGAAVAGAAMGAAAGVAVGSPGPIAGAPVDQAPPPPPPPPPAAPEAPQRHPRPAGPRPRRHHPWREAHRTPRRRPVRRRPRPGWGTPPAGRPRTAGRRFVLGRAVAGCHHRPSGQEVGSPAQVEGRPDRRAAGGVRPVEATLRAAPRSGAPDPDHPPTPATRPGGSGGLEAAGGPGHR